MVEPARELAAGRGLTDRADYRVGDFIEIADSRTRPMSLFSKVICCYPDAEALVRETLAHNGFTARWPGCFARQAAPTSYCSPRRFAPSMARSTG